MSESSVSGKGTFPPIRFSGQLRPSQKDVVKIAREKLAAGKRHIHIVAPPGSGKTVLGLYLWAEIIRRPAVVLSPNSAIQAQWAARTDLFDFDAHQLTVSTNPRQPGHLTSLTYQSVTMPEHSSDNLDSLAFDRWIDRLVEGGQAQDPLEAEVWINDLQTHNPTYHAERLAAYRKTVRDEASLEDGALGQLHASSMSTLKRLREQKIGLVILDECHHLMGHWGRVLADAHDFLEQPIILGLTATPPDRTGRLKEDIERYDAFFGPVDFEVPVPAVVKDGFLATYQDLAYLVRPSGDELSYIANADDQFQEIIADLCQPTQPADQPTLEASTAQQKTGTDVVTNTADGHQSESDASETTAPASKRSGSEPPTSAEPERAETGLDGGTAEEVHGSPQSAERQVELSGNDASAGKKSRTVRKKVPKKSTNKRTRSKRQLTSTGRTTDRVEPLPDWLYRILDERRLPTGVVKDWTGFERRDPQFATAARQFLIKLGIALPRKVPLPARIADTTDLADTDGLPDLEILVPVLDRYIRHGLRRSQNPEDHARAETAIQRMRMLGVQITEVGPRACASPVGRVMAYSQQKMAALLPILRAEASALGDRLRAVIVTDFEKTSAVTADVSHLLDKEAGGAVAAFRTLLIHDMTDDLNPVLVTGSSVLVDDDLADELMEAAERWLSSRNLRVELSLEEEDGFRVLNGRGADWCPRVYVGLITDLFQSGLTKCLVGTRGLLGEGWDANKINVLIDLTTATTSMTVNQLRGRSIRLDPDDPEKLANNWDVVCLAPEFSKGLDDYARFERKHQVLYGITDDGEIEKGVGHVHPAFTTTKPEGLENNLNSLNADMLRRTAQRSEVRKSWRVGEPYRGEPIRTVELRSKKSTRREFPPYKGRLTEWSDNSLSQAIGRAILEACYESSLLPTRREMQVTQRSGGYLRMFLEEATEAESELFANALSDAFGPLDRPRYIVPRFVVVHDETWLSNVLPELIGQWFRQTRSEFVMWHAVPTVLSRNKQLAATYQKHWNRHVSPGDVVYGYSADGEQFIEAALRNGKTPQTLVHQKEVLR